MARNGDRRAYRAATDLSGALALALDGRRRDAFAPARRMAPTFAHYIGDADRLAPTSSRGTLAG